MTTTHPVQGRRPDRAPSPAERFRLELRAAALRAAARGWPVFPCEPDGKHPAVTDWEHAASIDPDWIRHQWRRRPFNPAIATGPAGLVVLDLDVADPEQPHPDGREVPPGGWHGWHALRDAADAAGEPMPSTATVLTPSGGAHCYFAAPRGRELRNTASVLGWKLDTRAAGGFVIAAGARLAPALVPAQRQRGEHGRDVRRYSWWPDAGTEVTPLPEWLADRLGSTTVPPATAGRSPGGALPAQHVELAVPGHAQRYVAAALDAELRRVGDVVPGTRNNQLFIAAAALGELVAGGSLDASEVRASLLTEASAHVRAGAYSHTQALKTIDSGLRRGAQRPRAVLGAGSGPAARCTSGGA